MKFKKQAFILLAMACAFGADAYDFAKSGIYYNIVSDDLSTVEVTSNGNNTYSGSLTIKGSVSYSGKDYTVVGIGKSAFSGSERLTSVTLPETVTYIDDNAFFRCRGLKNVQIPVAVTSIGLRAFEECTSIESIELPSTVKKLGMSAFAGCSALKTVSLSPSLSNVPNSTFYGCAALEEVNIPEGVQTFGNQVFQGCKSLVSIAFPSTVTTLGNHQFSGCGKLADVRLPDGMTSLPAYCFAYCSSLENITIPSGVNNMADHVFQDCVMLEKVSLPTAVTAIPAALFAGCSNLSEVVMEEVETIDQMAFYECAKLSAIELPETLRSIGTFAFYSTGLTSLTLPSSLTEVHYSAFDNCNQMTALTVKPSSEKLVFGYNPSNTGQYVRFDLLPLASIDLGRDISYYRDEASTSFSPFKGASNDLKTVVVGDDVTDAALLCLNEKKALQRVEFGTGLAAIPEMNSCTALREIELKSTQPQAASEFTDEQYATVTLYVPQGSLSAYCEAPVWGKFAHIVERTMSLAPSLEGETMSVSAANGVLLIEGADELEISVYSAVTGQAFYSVRSYDGAPIPLPEGIYVVKVADKVVKVSI